MPKGDFSYIFSPVSGKLADQYLLHPATTGVPAVGVALTSGVGTWGSYADIVAANAITVEFFLCGFFINTLGAIQIFEVQIADSTPTVLSEFRIDPTAVTPNLGYIPVGPTPIYMAANSQIQGRSGGAAGAVIGVTILYTTG